MVVSDNLFFELLGPLAVSVAVDNSVEVFKAAETEKVVVDIITVRLRTGDAVLTGPVPACPAPTIVLAAAAMLVETLERPLLVTLVFLEGTYTVTFGASIVRKVVTNVVREQLEEVQMETARLRRATKAARLSSEACIIVW